MSPAIGTGPSQHGVTTLKGGGPVGTTNGHSSSNGAILKGPGRIYPYIEDLTHAQPEVGRDASMRTILEAGEALAKRADTDYDFKRLDLALKNHTMALTVLAEVVPHHRNYPDLRSERQRGGDLWRLWTGLQKRIQSQQQKFDEVKELIKEDNVRSGVRPSKEHSTTDSIERVNGVERTLDLLQEPKNDETISNSSTDSGYGGSIDSHPSNQTRQKPAINPKPAALHGNAIQQGNAGENPADLAARFARLRTSEPATPPVQDPRIRTRPIEVSEKKSEAIIEKPANVPSRPMPRPSGPREMPSVPKTPFKTSNTKIEMPSMPRPPAAIYTPSRSTDSVATHNLPSSNPRGTSFYGSKPSTRAESPKVATPPTTGESKDYFVAAHSTSGSNGPVRSRKSLDLPDSSTITAPELLDYQQRGARILLVDLRDRADFDNGHIMSQSIICIDRPSLREGMSAEKLAESLVLSPDSEQKLYEQRQQYDLIVYYDQASRTIPLRSSPELNNALRIFPQIIFEHAYEKRLKRRPLLLVGGLDAWIDLVSPGSLQTSKTNSQVGVPNKGPDRKAAAQKTAAQKLIRQRQISISRPLSKQEEEKWDKTLTSHESLGAFGPDDGGLAYARTTEDIFARRFPPIDLESMSRPSSSAAYEPISIPKAPTRPPPALPRHKSSGILERAHKTSHTMGSAPPPIPPNRVTKPGETGLENTTGQICYLNSSIQSLSHTPAISVFLREFIFGQDGSRPPRKSNETSDPPQLMIRFLGNLMGHMWSGQYDYVAPRSFSQYVRAVHKDVHVKNGYRADTCFGSTTQHDAEEFLHWLIDILEDESNPYRNQTPYQHLVHSEADKQIINSMTLPVLANQELHRLQQREYSPITRLCRFMTVQTVTCLSCFTPSRTIDSRPIITITIENTVDLQSAIRKEYQANSDILSGDNAYSCAKCKRHTEAAKGNTFLHLPEYLIIAFNRAEWNQKSRSYEKRETLVTFPEILNMEPYYRIPAVHATPTETAAFNDPTTQQLQYECYAVIQHDGGLRSGHYWTLARSPIDGEKATGGKLGRWRQFNDKRVTDAAWADTQVKESSILFYRRKGGRGDV